MRLRNYYFSLNFLGMIQITITSPRHSSDPHSSPDLHKHLSPQGRLREGGCGGGCLHALHQHLCVYRHSTRQIRHEALLWWQDWTALPSLSEKVHIYYHYYCNAIGFYLCWKMASMTHFMSVCLYQIIIFGSYKM